MTMRADPATAVTVSELLDMLRRFQQGDLVSGFGCLMIMPRDPGDPTPFYSVHQPDNELPWLPKPPPPPPVHGISIPFMTKRGYRKRRSKVFFHMTPRQKAVYLTQPHKCPWCESESISNTEETENCGDIIQQSVHCHSCHRQWVDFYQLNDMDESDMFCVACDQILQEGEEIEAFSDGLRHTECLTTPAEDEDEDEDEEPWTERDNLEWGT